ncbi:MAG: divalent cation tolerance protein CutA [Candidatus Kerfeldbacteria bacterium]|nr:divalent cation tolerance protein CutA [Candidatus Kerfeldbacteria bacterium]
MKTAIWVIVNCKSLAEAQTIGEAVVAKRLAACFDVWLRQASGYFWPPRSGQLERGQGTTLVLTTTPTRVRAIERVVKQLHSDQVPFFGSVRVGHLSRAYANWLRHELREHGHDKETGSNKAPDR